MKGQIVEITSDGGIIKSENGERYFFYRPAFVGFWKDLKTDLDQGIQVPVQFEIKRTINRTRARKVSRLDFPNQAGDLIMPESEKEHVCFMCKETCNCGAEKVEGPFSKGCHGCRRCVVDGPPDDKEENSVSSL